MVSFIIMTSTNAPLKKYKKRYKKHYKERPRCKRNALNAIIFEVRETLQSIGQISAVKKIVSYLVMTSTNALLKKYKKCFKKHDKKRTKCNNFHITLTKGTQVLSYMLCNCHKIHTHCRNLSNTEKEPNKIYSVFYTPSVVNPAIVWILWNLSTLSTA